MDTPFALVSREEIWRLHEDMKHVYSVQAEHADRLLRLERRQEDDARMKSVWSTSSPFPSVLGGTPQQDPIHNPPAEVLSNLDEGHQLNLLGNLQLDQEDGPKRGASRANSVRFDESAIHGHWAQLPRSSGDLFPIRTGSGLGSHPMVERSTSHKSEGRQSSAGQSIHSGCSAAPSARNGLGLDTSFLPAQPNGSAFEASGPPPGMALLGPMPSIIRCWLDTNFSHETLIYAAVCTGSYESYLNQRLVRHLGLEDHLQIDSAGKKRIKLPMYLPEAVVQQPSSRSGSPPPQLPALTVTFTVFAQPIAAQLKQMEVFLGSDVLRQYHADVLLSSNTMTLTGENNKFSVPLVRPEERSLFTSLYTAAFVPNDVLRSAAHPTEDPKSDLRGGRDHSVVDLGTAEPNKHRDPNAHQNNGAVQRSRGEPPFSPVSLLSQLPASDGRAQGDGRKSDSFVHVAEPESHSEGDGFMRSASSVGREHGTTDRYATEESRSRRDKDQKRIDEDDTSVESPAVRGSPTGVWGPWRREPGQRGDGPNGNSAGGSGYQRAGRPPRGTKVLRPSKSSISSSSSPRSFSTSQAPPGGAGPDLTSSNRPRDHTGTAAAGVEGPPSKESTRRAISGDFKLPLPSHPPTKELRSPTSQPRLANPVGGASAFAWLNGGPPPSPHGPPTAPAPHKRISSHGGLG